MNISREIGKFFYNMSVNELREINSRRFTHISYNSLLYLNIISDKENCTVSFLAETLNISKPAVTIKINELMKQGLVAKTRSKTDMRVKYLSVTKQIAKEFHDYEKMLLPVIKRIKSRFSEEDINKFLEILGMISKFGEYKND